MESDMQICILCFKNSTQTPLLHLWDTGEDKIVFAEKLQSFITEQKLVHTPYTLLCTECARELFEAYNFKAKVISSQSLWRSTCTQPVSFTPPESSDIMKTYDPCNVGAKHEIIQSNADLSEIKQFENFAVITSIGNNLDVKEDDNNINHNEQHYSVQDCLMDDSLSLPEKDIKINEIINELDQSEDLDNPDDPTNDLLDNDCLECLRFTCLQCSVSFTSSSELSEHICKPTPTKVETKKKVITRKYKKRKPRPKSQKVKFTCDICGYVTDKQWKLHKHSASVHHDKTFVCDFCPKAFKQSYHLREHVTIHTGEKKYSCNFCDKKFQRISSQKRHIRSHEAPPGEKVKKRPYLCPICGKSFPYNNGAQRHMRTHTGEKRFQCNICKKQFVQSTHLQVHLRIHTGEKPYMCNVCGDSFTLKALLQKHFNVHNEDNKNDVKIYQNLEPNLSATLHSNRAVNNILMSESGMYNAKVEILNNQEYIVTAPA